MEDVSARLPADLLRMEWTVLRRTDQASLWKQTTTDVCGRSARCLSAALHHSCLMSGSDLQGREGFKNSSSVDFSIKFYPTHPLVP